MKKKKGRVGRLAHLGGLCAQQLLHVLDAKVAHADGADLTGADELLQLAPRVDKVPVRVVLLEVVGVGGARPVHEVQVDIVGLQAGEAALDGLGDALVPGVVELGGQEDVAAGHARGLDAVADLLLVAVRKGRVDVAVPVPERRLDRRLDLVRLGLPRPEADGRDLGARVEGEGLAGGIVSGDVVRTRQDRGDYLPGVLDSSHGGRIYVRILGRDVF